MNSEVNSGNPVLEIAGITIALVVMVVSCCFGVVYLSDKTECSNIEKNSSNVTTDWRGPIAGCYVTENGVTIPLDRWRVFSDNG